MRSNDNVAALFDEAKHAQPDELTLLERLREEGDYAALADLLPDDWQNWNVWDQRTVRVRLLVADVLDRQGDIEGMRCGLEPYIKAIDGVPFALADRLFVALANYKQSVGEPAQALQLVKRAKAFLRHRKNTFFLGEALQLQAELLCGLGRLDQAITSFRQAATSYTEHGRRYRCGLVSVRLGETLFCAGKLIEARDVPENADKLLAGSRDRLALASAREDFAAVHCVMGHHHEALKNLAQAAGIYQDLGGDADLAIALIKTALVFHLMERRTEAVAYQSQALNAAAKAEIESYWSWTQAIRKTDGDASLAAKLMGVSADYVRKLRQLIREGSSPGKIEKKKNVSPEQSRSRLDRTGDSSD